VSSLAYLAGYCATRIGRSDLIALVRQIRHRR